LIFKVIPFLPPYTPNTENELIAMLKSRSEQAFSYLYDHYAGALYGVIIKMISREEVAKDLLQEVFVKIWRNIDTYDTARGRLYTWMLNIARNAAIDVLRSSDFSQERKTSELGNTVYQDNSMLATVLRTDHLGLKQVVDGLKEDYKQVIDLAYFKGYTQEEIAKELNIPLGTVKTRSRNALLQLKSLMR
jgi:RNA polymerase sigma factor (sigma-70 family)